MLIGYARVSKADGSQSLDLQHDALRAAGVEPGNIYDDRASGSRDDRPGLAACLKSLRDGDVLIVWKLDRLGRTLTHLVSTVQNLSDRGIGLRVLTGKGAQIDTTTPSGRMVFGIFATLAEFERDMIRERTMAGLAAARARGRKGGRKFALSKAQVRLAQAAMAQRALLQTLTRFPRLGSCTVKVSCDERFQRTAFYRRGHPMGGALVLSIRHQLP